MPTKATLKIIDSLLKQADTAIVGQQWNTVHVLAEEILKLDKTNGDALSLKNTAMRVLVNPPVGGDIIRPESIMTVLPDPNLPDIPPDPDDAIYYPVSAAQFVGQYANVTNYGGSVTLNQDSTQGYVHASLNFADGIRIWGFRCPVWAVGGLVNVNLGKAQYRIGSGGYYMIGERQTAELVDAIELRQTGLNEIVNNREYSYDFSVGLVGIDLSSLLFLCLAF